MSPSLVECARCDGTVLTILAMSLAWFLGGVAISWATAVSRARLVRRLEDEQAANEDAGVREAALREEVEQLKAALVRRTN